MAGDKTTAAHLLQQKADDANRASDVIDRDPEEALAKLAPHVNVDPSAGELTLRDIFGLFVQLQKQTNAMQERMAEQQESLVRVLTKQSESQGRSKADTQRELEEAAAQQRATLQAWKDEPKEPVFLQPEVSEEKIFAVMNEYPPRVFRINGLEFPIPVGQVVNVPGSVAAMVRHSQKQKIHRIYRPVQDTESIPRPQHVQFLASAQEVSAGQAGVAGEGRLIPSAVAPDPSSAQPLDYRYDAWGR